MGDAEPLYREALAGCRRTLGGEHPSTLHSINSMASILLVQGNKAEALEMYRQALAVSRRVLGDAHPETQKWAQWLKEIDK